MSGSEHRGGWSPVLATTHSFDFPGVRQLGQSGSERIARVATCGMPALLKRGGENCSDIEGLPGALNKNSQRGLADPSWLRDSDGEELLVRGLPK